MALVLTGTAEYELLAFNKRHDLLVTADLVAGACAHQNSRAPLDLVAVVDVSFSMSGELDLVKQTLKFMVTKLHDMDRLSIVAFGSNVTVVLSATFMTAVNKRMATTRIEGISIEGCTFLSGGLLKGIELLYDCNRADSIKTVLLFTDGEPTNGITDGPGLAKAAAEAIAKREHTKNASVFTFGYGGYHNASMLRAVADGCRGMYYFVQNAQHINTAFGDCLGGLLTVVAREVVLSVHPSSSSAGKGVSIKKLMCQFPHRQFPDGHFEITIGELFAEERRNIPFLLEIPQLNAAAPELAPIVHLQVKYIDVVKLFNLTLDFSVKIGRPDSQEVPVERVPQSAALDEQRNRISVAEAVERATELGNAGKITEARATLQRALDQIDVSISGQSTFSQNLVRDLKQCIANIDPSSYQHVGSKYMYSLSRSLYTQRSSGISSGAASAFATNAQRSMIQQMNGGGSGSVPSRALVPSSSSSSSSSFSSSSSTSTSSSSVSSASVPAKVQQKKTNTQQTPTTSVASPAAAAPSSVQKSDPAAAPVPASRQVSSQQTIARAVKRLMADLAEIMACPLSSVSARPLESDIFEWHCSIRGPNGSPYSGIVFHLIMQFPDNYPFKPPTLYFCSFIEHQHVFGSWVCLDMLQEAQFASDEEMDRPYTGWSSAYSVQSILLQLQAFLFDEAGRDKASVQKASLSASRFKCETCGHCAQKPWPAVANAKPQRLQAVGPAVGAAPANAIVPSARVAKPAAFAQKPPAGAPEKKKKPQQDQAQSQPQSPQQATTSTKPSEAAMKAVPASSSPSPVVKEQSWQTVISKRTKRMEKLIHELGYDPRQRRELQEHKSTAFKAAASSRLQPNKKATASSVVADDDELPRAPSRPAVARVPVGGEVLVRRAVEAPAAAASTALPLKSKLTPEEKQKKRAQQKAKSRSLKRQAKRQGQLAGGGGGGGESPAKVAAAPAEATPVAEKPISSNVTKKQEEDGDDLFLIVGRRHGSAASSSSSPSSSTIDPVRSSVKRNLCSELMPTVPETALERELMARLKDKTLTGIDTSLFGFLSDELIYLIFSFMLPTELNDTAVVCKDFLRISGDRRLWRSLFMQRYRPALRLDSEFAKFSVQDWKLLFTQENILGRAGLNCYHSKVDFREAILGVPIVVQRRARFDELTSPFELLSEESFNDAQVRKSVWGLPFTHWLPLWIDSDHGERAWPLIERAIASLSFRTGGVRFEPEMALTILPRLMNNLVVKVMSGDIHASIKSLEGYCGFHRLLIAFVQRYPRLLAKVNKTAANFAKFEPCRNKENLPNLGEFLPLLTVSTTVSWRDIAVAYLQENFDRNALWAIKKYPQLANISQKQSGANGSGVDSFRLTKTFEATIVSMRLLCFHVYFFQLARPDGVSLDALASNYDAFFGIPSSQMKEALQAKIFEVLHNMKDWKAFFGAINMKLPTQENINTWLVQAVGNSARKGYHSAGSFRK